MNGYVKMKRLRRAKITKIISAVTALSMTVTGMAVAASADSASPDFISEALGDLTSYGIVANDLVNLVDFESNFAVKNIDLGSHFHLENFAANKQRTVSFAVTCEGHVDAREPKNYYFGVYSGGTLIDIGFNGVHTDEPSPIRVEFTEPGTKRFTFTIPSKYRNDFVTIHKLEPIYDDDGMFFEFVIADAGVVLAPQSDFETECLISDTLKVGGESFGSNKVIKVGSDIYSRISGNGGEVFYTMPRMDWHKPEGGDYWEVTPALDNDGNQIYDNGVKIANGSVRFEELPGASAEMERLLNLTQSASDRLASITGNSDNVTVYSVTGSINCGSEEAKTILNEYARIKDNPNAYLLVNVTLNEGENAYVFNSGAIGAWDANEASRVIFNFMGGNVNSTHISLGDGFRGTALAPNARVSVVSTICGAIYAPQITISSGEVHMAPYRTLNHVYETSFYEQETAVTSEEEETTTPEETTVPPEEETTTPSSEDTTTSPETEETSVSSETEETDTSSTEDISLTSETTPETSTPETTPDTTPRETTPDTTEPETTPETSVPETTPDTTPHDTTPDTTEPETTPETSAPETTPDTTPHDTTPDITEPESTPETSAPETTPDTTPRDTTPDSTEPETTPETSDPETTPDTTPRDTTPSTAEPETTPETSVPETTPETTVPVTTPNTTVSESTPEETPRETTFTGRFEVPTTTTTTVPETTPEVSEATTTSAFDTTTPPSETTTVDNFGDENTTVPETTPDTSVFDFIVPETTPAATTQSPHFEVPQTTTTVGVYSEENTTTPPPSVEVTTTAELPATTTVPITFELEEEVPRGVVPPEVPLIEIDEEVPLSDRPMSTGVDSKVGLFAIIGGAALVIGVSAQAYSVFIKKKN